LDAPDRLNELLLSWLRLKQKIVDLYRSPQP